VTLSASRQADRSIERAHSRADRGISEALIDRLSHYLRILEALRNARAEMVSSYELSDLAGLRPALVRSDLAHFGRFGIPGRGYAVAGLADALQAVLGVDRFWSTIIVGASMLDEIGFYRQVIPECFAIVGVYDIDDQSPAESTIDGWIVGGITDLEADLAAARVQIGIVSVLPSHTQRIVDTLAAGGVQAILTYGSTPVWVPKAVELRQIDALAALQELTYHLRAGFPHSGWPAAA
jgi:redox-sensing transcriptional repressor